MLQNPPNPDNDKFGISEDGKLKVKHELDYEVQKEYTLTVIAQDCKWKGLKFLNCSNILTTLDRGLAR